MTIFDPIKALKEEITGLGEVKTALIHRERHLSAKFGELEIELNGIIKLRGFAEAEIERKRGVLRGLEDGVQQTTT